MCFTRVSITPSIIKVKPLPLLAQGTETVPHLAVGRDDSGDFCGDVATVLEEIEMPPGSFSGIVDLAALVESWILETRPFLKIDPYVEFQQRWLLLGRNHLQ
jgi:hypothetical protein